MTQNIGWQVVLIPVLSFLWDWWTGWRGWSVDFVLPCVCIVGILAMLLIAVLCKTPLRLFAGPLIGACFFGLLPLILIACGRVRVLLPSLLCAGLAILSLAALVLFQWQTTRPSCSGGFICKQKRAVLPLFFAFGRVRIEMVAFWRKKPYTVRIRRKDGTLHGQKTTAAALAAALRARCCRSGCST